MRARNHLSGNGCNGSLFDYRMCQLQPCMCVLTREFYTAATGQKVPADSKYTKTFVDAENMNFSLKISLVI